MSSKHLIYPVNKRKPTKIYHTFFSRAIMKTQKIFKSHNLEANLSYLRNSGGVCDPGGVSPPLKVSC